MEQAAREQLEPHRSKAPALDRQERTHTSCLIVGCGGHGRVVLDILNASSGCQVVGFVDSNPQMVGRRVDGVRVLGRPDDVLRIRNETGAQHAIIAIGDNGTRRAYAERLESLGFELINAIHPSANLARNVSLGKNVVVAAGAVACAHCQIGDSVILNTGCIVDHESLIGTSTHVCPGARIAGRVTVESGAFIGIGATIVQSVRIGYESVVGAGAVVIHDVPPMTTVVGVPAHAVRRVDSSMDVLNWLRPEIMPVSGQKPGIPSALP